MPAAFALSQSRAYTTGRVYGHDVSSGAAVAVLLTDRYDAPQDHPSSPQPTTTAPDEEQSATTTTTTTSSLVFRVLDLCCAPGLKLCAMADWLSQQQQQPQQQPSGRSHHHTNHPLIHLVGVDVSEARLTLCKRVVHKYWIHPETSGRPAVRLDDNDDHHHHQTHSSQRNAKDSYLAPLPIHIQLFCNDGTRFGRIRRSEKCDKKGEDDDDDDVLNLVFDSNVAHEETATLGGRQRMNKSARARERKRLKQIMNDGLSLQPAADQPGTSPWHSEGESRSGKQDTDFLFDRVLVDAECSTDGSLKHVQKKLDKLAKGDKKEEEATTTTTTNELIPMLTDRHELSKLTALQRNLIESGFQLLKDGGRMVYSTCSLSNEQNEEVVQWLLDSHDTTAKLVPVDYRRFARHSESVRPGTLAGTVRFVPHGLVSTATATAAAAGVVDVAAEDHFYGGGFFLAKIQKVPSTAART